MCEKLRHVELNEGLESLGKTENACLQNPEDKTFCGSRIENIRIPSTLKVVGHDTFRFCESLKRVEFAEGTESLGKDDENSDGWQSCFEFSSIEEVVFPGTLKEVWPDIFKYCKSLKTVRVAKDCPVCVEKLVGSNVEVRRE